MKKVLLLTSVSIILLFLFTACKSKSTPIADVKTDSKDTTTESFELAKSELNIEKCATIENKDDRKNCEEIVIVDIIRNAVEKKDTKLCDKIDDKSKKQECVENVNKL